MSKEIEPITYQPLTKIAPKRLKIKGATLEIDLSGYEGGLYINSDYFVHQYQHIDTIILYVQEQNYIQIEKDVPIVLKTKKTQDIKVVDIIANTANIHLKEEIARVFTLNIHQAPESFNDLTLNAHLELSNVVCEWDAFGTIKEAKLVLEDQKEGIAINTLAFPERLTCRSNIDTHISMQIWDKPKKYPIKASDEGYLVGK